LTCLVSKSIGAGGTLQYALDFGRKPSRDFGRVDRLRLLKDGDDLVKFSSLRVLDVLGRKGRLVEIELLEVLKVTGRGGGLGSIHTLEVLENADRFGGSTRFDKPEVRSDIAPAVRIELAQDVFGALQERPGCGRTGCNPNGVLRVLSLAGRNNGGQGALGTLGETWSWRKVVEAFNGGVIRTVDFICKALLRAFPAAAVFIIATITSTATRGTVTLVFTLDLLTSALLGGALDIDL
jgi:hypothetical protein